MKSFFQWLSRSSAREGDSTAPIRTTLSELGCFQLADEVAAFSLTGADQALRVTVFGEYSVGKSTLINALLGEQVLVARTRPTTGMPAEVREGRDAVRVRFRNGKEQRISRAQASTYSDLGSEHRARDEIDRIIISMRSPLLEKGIALIDTPGLLDSEKQTERARCEVAAADIVLLVLRADHLLSKTERSFAVDWLTGDLGKPVVPVINFMSQTDPEGHNELRAMLRAFTSALIRPFDKPWYEVDALPALRYRLGQQGVASPTDDFANFGTALGGISGTRIRELKQESRARWRSSWLVRAKKENDETLQKLERESLLLAQERTAQAERIEARLARIRRNSAGELARCLVYVDQHKTGQSLAVSNALPLPEKLKTDEQRKAAARAVMAAQESANALIDQNANEVLMTIALDAEVVLDPLSLRELAAVEVPRGTAIAVARARKGLKWGTILGGGGLLVSAAFPPAAPFAAPAAVVGLVLGFRFGNTSKQVAAFRKKFCDAADAHLQKLKLLLSAKFKARMEELDGVLGSQIKAIRTLPTPGHELTLRRKLDALLAEPKL